MPFNVNKYHILHVGTRDQKFDYEMNGVKLDSVQCVKDLGVSIASNLKFSQQFKDANRMLGFINKNFFFKNKDIILSLYISQISPRICCAVLVAPSYKGHSKIKSRSAKGYEDDNIPT